MKYIGNYKSLIVNEHIDKLELPDTFEKRQNKLINILEFEPGKLKHTYNDQFVLCGANPVKYLVFLNDWSIGYIFTYNDQMLADYKQGDVFQLDNDSNIIYTWANIAYEGFSVLEITLYD